MTKHTVWYRHQESDSWATHREGRVWAFTQETADRTAAEKLAHGFLVTVTACLDFRGEAARA